MTAAVLDFLNIFLWNSFKWDWGWSIHVCSSRETETCQWRKQIRFRSLNTDSGNLCNYKCFSSKYVWINLAAFKDVISFVLQFVYCDTLLSMSFIYNVRDKTSFAASNHFCLVIQWVYTSVQENVCCWEFELFSRPSVLESATPAALPHHHWPQSKTSEQHTPIWRRP